LYNNKNNVYRNESLTFSFMDVTPTNYSRKMHVFHYIDTSRSNKWYIFKHVIVSSGTNIFLLSNFFLE